MMFMYFFIVFCMMSVVNVYIVWFMMEMLFLFFLLVIINKEMKSVGLVVYFFFQSVCSLLLFVSMILMISKLVSFLLFAKLGLFPFFYWVIVVSTKLGVWGNIFVLGFQKISVFWLYWLLNNVSISFLYLFVYLGMFFITVNLLFVSDLWLLLVYSSVVNSGLILLSSFGSHYFFVMFLYLLVIVMILFLIMYLDSYMEMLLLMFMFLIIPPFILFFMKFYIMYSMESMMKLVFYISIFDILILFYYFTLIFMKFMIMEMSVYIYFMNMILVISLLFFSNCVTMIIFYKS